MDIDGAKALKERLARTAWAKARPASVEVPAADAPPVYHWFSAGRNADGAAPAPSSGDAVSADGSSTLGRLGLPPTS